MHLTRLYEDASVEYELSSWCLMLLVMAVRLDLFGHINLHNMHLIIVLNERILRLFIVGKSTILRHIDMFPKLAKFVCITVT